MPKASARFRNRKINFRTRISIRKGPIDLSDDQEDEEFSFEDSRRHSSFTSPKTESRNLVETGVDKEEESELHLQKVINASAAALLRSSVNPNAPVHPSIVSEVVSTAAESSEAAIRPIAEQASQNVPHIPIPDATGLVDPAAYEALYAKSKLFLPSSYIRFSDTVEDTLGGVIYTMDDEDETWLGHFNSAQAQAHKVSESAGSEESAKARRANARKGKEKERAFGQEPEGPGRLSEDDFEALMDHFEKTTEETVPGLHLDISRLPSLTDFEHTFESALINPRLPTIKIFAKFVYSHWKERRLKRGGKSIMPAIDFDESNENNPYVCFRRREIKMVRKTRRTDAQNMDRLVRLRNDLYKAQELLNTVLMRERVKREAVELEKVIFEGRCRIRDMKRALNQPDGDEELLVSKKEKRRKKEGSTNGLLKSPLRKTAELDESAPNSAGANLQDVNVLKERARNSVRLMDRELNRRRDEQLGWEDFTDSGHQPPILNPAAHRWRGTTFSDLPTASRASKEITLASDSGIAPAISVLSNNQFRRRVGRGGRFTLDRILAPRQRTRAAAQAQVAKAPDDSEEAARHRRLLDRWRYDDDLRNDFPFVDDPQVIDDYSLPYSSRRRDLLDLDDQDCLDPHSETYLAQVSAYLDRVPEPDPPLVKIGKLPSKVFPNLLGIGLGRNQIGNGSPTTLQEQILSVQAAVHAQGLGPNHQTTKRMLSGVVGAQSLSNVNGTAQTVSAQSIPRLRRNQSGPVLPAQNGSTPVPVSNGKGSSLHPQSMPHHNLPNSGWHNNASAALPASVAPSANHSVVSSGGSGSTNSTSSSSAPMQHSQIPPSHTPGVSYSNNIVGGTGGLSRSIPIPANNTSAPPGPRPMSGINISGGLPPNPMLMPHPTLRSNGSFGSAGSPHQASGPFISRPGSASSPPPNANQQISRHPSPSMMSIKGSPGARSAKRPPSAMGQQSQSHSAIANHLLVSNSPSPSPSIYNNNGVGKPSFQHSPSPPPLQPSGGMSSPMKNHSHGGPNAKAGINNLHSHHPTSNLINGGHPQSPHQHPSGNAYNPMFSHQGSPGQGVSNSAAAAPTPGFS